MQELMEIRLLLFAFIFLINYCFPLPIHHESSLFSANLLEQESLKESDGISKYNKLEAYVEAVERQKFPCFKDTYDTVRGGDAFSAFQSAIFAIIDELGHVGRSRKHFTVTIGNHKCEKLWYFESKEETVNETTPFTIYSASKWLVGVTILAALYDPANGLGSLREDDSPLDYKISDCLTDYWTGDPMDARSDMTFKHLLSFTSGYHVEYPLNRYHNEYFCKGISLQACVKDHIYESSYFNTGWARTDPVGTRECQWGYTDTGKCEAAIVPGASFEYNLIHLQIAGAAIEKKTETCFQDLIRKYVFVPAGMNPTVAPADPKTVPTCYVEDPVPAIGTCFASNKPPSLGGAMGNVFFPYAGIRTTPLNYNKFLHHYLHDDFKNADNVNYFNSTIRKIMETVPFKAKDRSQCSWHRRWPLYEVEDSRQFALGHWFHCRKPYGADITDEDENGLSCFLNKSHHCSGAMGFRPAVNRRFNFTILIGTQEVQGNLWSTLLSNRIEPVIIKLFEAEVSLQSEALVSLQPEN